MITHQYQVQINRPVQGVWDFLMDIRSDARWVAGVQEGWMTSEGELSVGTTFRYKMRVMGLPAHSDIVVTGHEAPRWHEVKVRSAPIQFTSSYRLEPGEGGTKLTMEMRGQPSLLLRPAERLFDRILHRQWRQNALRLKALLDAGANPIQDDAAP